ncbi:HAD family hydrolase [Lonsdalea quercina]|uniref:HAD family hydrolase n=1 Tax=Lonsdalea quercina TaxID=71657 RepID=UPI003976F9A8
MKKYDAAFFDFDETVVCFKTMFSFMRFYWGNMYENGGLRFDEYMRKVEEQWVNNIPREIINREYYENFKDEKINDVHRIIPDWIQYEKNKYAERFFVNESILLISKYNKANVSVVFVSGSMFDIISPIASELGVTNIIATRVKENNDVFTGEILPPQTIGNGKAVAVEKYIRDNSIDINKTISYGDHYSDFPMLSATSEGFVISNDKDVLVSAKREGLGIIERL